MFGSCPHLSTCTAARAPLLVRTSPSPGEARLSERLPIFDSVAVHIQRGWLHVSDLFSNSFDDAMAIVADRDPRDFRYGYLAFGDAPAGIGGGTGVFAWFASHAERLDFWVDKELGEYWLSETPRGESDAVKAAIRAAVAEVGGLGAGDAPVSKANAILSGMIELKWWGELDDLLAGSTEFAIALRSDFLEEENDGDSVVPRAIAPGELDEFVEFLRESGF